jgi:hypothetical protein
MKAAILFLSLAALALPARAIDGTVINRTSGKPQPGATVSLYKLGQDGMESLESVKSDAQGRFQIKQDVQGPRLIQTAFDGVTYNHMLPPGSSSTGIALEVYNSSRQPGAAKVAQHMMLFEPSGGQMVISETYIYQNDGKVTYNDPEGGTLKFYLPPAAKGIVQVNATAPQGMPVQRAAEKSPRAGVYKVDFPIKPGETRIDLTYLVPYQDSATFEGRILHKDGPTRLITPSGVTLKGDNIASLGAEPRTQANIYDVKGSEFRVQIEGAGSLRAAETESQESSGPSIEQIMPRVYRSAAWIVGLALGVLALGFILLYRAQPAGVAPAPPATNRPPAHQRPPKGRSWFLLLFWAAKGRNERSRR